MIVREIPCKLLSASELMRAINSRGEFGPPVIWEQGRYSYIGVVPHKTIHIHHDTVTVCCKTELKQQRQTNLSSNPLDILSNELALSNPLDSDEEFELKRELLPPFIGGAIGFVGYDTSRYFEPALTLKVHSFEPDLYFVIYDTFIVIDNELSETKIISWQTATDYANNSIEIVNQLECIIKETSHLQDKDWNVINQSAESLDFESMFTDCEFIDIVRRAKDYIAAGDIFQVVLSHRLLVKCNVNPLVLYDLLKAKNPSQYHFFVPFGEHVLVGASPEVMLRGCNSIREKQNSGSVFMRPVAGTYPRGKTPEQDVELARQLKCDEKECAEHIMLVDLERNDIGKVSVTGSVKVSDLLSVESYSHVHHLVSQVSGKLKPSETVLSALESCFPIGTLAGTPKIRAMEIIAELEGTPRGIFGGAVVALGYDGFIDSCVAIRSVVVGKHFAVVRAGAGIVHDSIPAREHEECMWKAQALLETIKTSLGVTAA